MPIIQPKATRADEAPRVPSIDWRQTTCATHRLLDQRIGAGAIGAAQMGPCSAAQAGNRAGNNLLDGCGSSLRDGTESLWKALERFGSPPESPHCARSARALLAQAPCSSLSRSHCTHPEQEHVSPPAPQPTGETTLGGILIAGLRWRASRMSRRRCCKSEGRP